MQLNYKENGIFRIIQITDTHLGNKPYNNQDLNTFSLIDDLVEYFDDVDLIMHTGDIIWSEGVKDADVIFEEVMERFNKTDVPFAITFGNHDSEEIITRSDLRKIYNRIIENKPQKNHSLIVDDREAYTLEILSNDLKNVENVLYIMDSGAEASLPIGIYDWNQPEQVAWFKETADIYYQGNNEKKDLVFQHIPIPEYYCAKENIIDGVAFETDEEISAPHINTGLFANMLLNGEVWGMFVGHDHENNFDGIHQGIHLVYGNVSGYNTYGEISRGVRLIEIDNNKNEIRTEIIKAEEFRKPE